MSVSTALMGRGAALANALVADEPGVIIGPIAQVFGYIIDFVFNLVYTLSVNHSLGFSIIFLTIIVRCLMLPMGIKQQKSMIKMQKLNPELEKIKAKYGNSKDPEIMRKMNTEQQALYAKNKVNPLGGCLPLLITMPLFFGLSYIMNQSYLYITKLRDIYNQLSVYINDFFFSHAQDYTLLKEVSLPHVSQKMLDAGAIDFSVPESFSKVLNKLTDVEWGRLLDAVTPDQLPRIQVLFEEKEAIEMFFGLPLLEQCGWALPGVLIPILVALTSFATSWVSSRASTSTDDRMRTQQKVMMYVFPAMMVFMTVGLPAGVGLYWITSSVFQVVQQAVLNQRAGFPLFKPRKSETK